MTDQTHPTLVWPLRPVCHDKDMNAMRYGAPEWQKRDGLRRCSYCGSLHPEDLMHALKAGARLETADWKYGWTHKFYVEGIPNPNAGKEVSKSYGSGPLPLPDEKRTYWTNMGSKVGCRVEFTEGEGRWNAKLYEPDTPTTWGKFYNVHLQDLDLATFDALAPMLNVGTGVEFSRDEQGIKYKAVAPEPWIARGKPADPQAPSTPEAP